MTYSSGVGSSRPSGKARTRVEAIIRDFEYDTPFMRHTREDFTVECPENHLETVGNIDLGLTGKAHGAEAEPRTAPPRVAASRRDIMKLIDCMNSVRMY